MDMYIEYYNNDMLMNNFLIKNGYEKIKAISFSHTIDKNRGQYYLAFSEAENNIYNR